MTSLPLDRPAQPNPPLPPIIRLPGVEDTLPHGYDLQDVAARSQTCDRLEIDLPVSVSCAFWLVTAASGVVGGWATAVLTRQAACSGTVCRIALLGDRPLLVAVLAANCVVVLLVLAAITRGLTRAGVPELALMVVAAGAGIVSMLGVVAVVALAVLIAVMGAAALVLVFDRD